MTATSINKTPAHDSLLKAAWVLLVENNGDMRAVKMDHVVKAANLSSGAFYNVWPGGLQDFQQSLFEYALDEGRISYLENMIDDLAQATPATIALSELVRIFGAFDSQQIQADPAFRVQMSLWARHASDKHAAETLGQSYRDLSKKYIEVYETLVQSYGRRWTPPWTAGYFATVLTGLAEGLALRQSVDPDSVPQALERNKDGSPWDLFGIATASLLSRATEKITDTEDGSWVAVADLDH